MVDYYKVLGVKRTATMVEIKSAYRRLARQRHPDLNGGSDNSAREFALIALAYRTLSDPQERAYYDAQRERITSSNLGGSVFHSTNPHAQRLRRMAVQALYDKIVDQFFEAERRETFALQQAVFTTVTKDSDGTPWKGTLWETTVGRRRNTRQVGNISLFDAFVPLEKYQVWVGNTNFDERRMREEGERRGGAFVAPRAATEGGEDIVFLQW